MVPVKCQNLEDALVKLQAYVDATWHSYKGFKEKGHDKRKWLKAIPPDSYESDRYRMELWVLEGSPAKQIVLINHCFKRIDCFEGGGMKVKIFIWDPMHRDL